MSACAVLEDAWSGNLWAVLAVALAVLGEVVAVVFVVQVLLRKRSSSADVGWILFVLIAPYLGLAFYYLLPRRLHRRHLRRRSSRLAWIETSLEVFAPEPDGEEGLSDPLARLIARGDRDAVRGCNRVSLLSTGGEFAEAARAAIEQAAEFVHLQTYIFRPDSTGLRVLDVLAEAARRGVEVRLLYDYIGSWSLKRHHLEVLRDAGGRCEAFLPALWRRRPFTLNLRNHRKLLVVDGRVAVVGGRNVGDEYVTGRFGRSRRWLDTMVYIEGPIVPRMHRVFVEDWYTAAEEDLAQPRYFPDVGPAGEDQVGVVENGPDGRTGQFEWVFFQMLAMATESVRISSPYLIPTPTILTAVQVAAARGVRVIVYTNGRAAESPVMYLAKESFYRGLIESGVVICETTGDYNHTKMVLVDERYMFIGSQNLDARSAELNFELGVVTRDSPAIAAAVEMFDRQAAEARRLSTDDLQFNTARRLMQGICRILSPLL